MTRSASARDRKEADPRQADLAENHAPLASGRFLLRLDPGLHAALREAARAEDVSLNEYCVRKLAAPVGSLTSSSAAVAAVRRCASFFGGDLIAVVAFGSWARGEATEGSDVDLLAVVEDGIALTRELYRRWESEPLRADDRPVDAHFAHLPDPERASPGVWGEVAIDGVVLFERDLQLSLRLADVRRLIAAGRLVRRFAQGQPYWVDLRD